MQVATEEPPVVSFLKPGFTAIPNFFWDQGVIQNLKPSEQTLLLFLWRYISGYLKTGAIIGEGFLLEKTKFSLATFYAAKRRLCELGYIIVSHTQAGRCYYQLAPFLQAVRSDEERAADPFVKGFDNDPSSQSEGGPSSQLEGPLYKEKKENLDQHHYPQPSPLRRPGALLGSLALPGPVAQPRPAVPSRWRGVFTLAGRHPARERQRTGRRAARDGGLGPALTRPSGDHQPGRHRPFTRRGRPELDEARRRAALFGQARRPQPRGRLNLLSGGQASRETARLRPAALAS